MSDLISRSDLIEALLQKKSLMGASKDGLHQISMEGVIEYIEGFQTAFDLDKVVAELEKELNLADVDKERCLKENPLQFDSAKGYAHGIANAIEIVRKGGVDYDER